MRLELTFGYGDARPDRVSGEGERTGGVVVIGKPDNAYVQPSSSSFFSSVPQPQRRLQASMVRVRVRVGVTYSHAYMLEDKYFERCR